MNNKTLLDRYLKLKNNSGTHSPSVDELIRLLDLKIKVDACFLSNPYATDLFLDYLARDLRKKNFLKHLVEHYPPQNRDLAKRLAFFLKVDFENIFVGNGAIEVIEAILKNFVKGKISIPIPTFSSYYEFIDEKVTVPMFFEMQEESNFELDVDEYIKFIVTNKINNVVLINPNNPNGAYINLDKLIYLLEKFTNIDNVILDESFIHFAFEDDSYKLINLYNLVDKYSNLTIIKSMSKDFGIAGIRFGYAVTSKEKISFLLKSGYLWNVNNLANYFLNLYVNNDFQTNYEFCRKKYIVNTLNFYENLTNVNSIKVFPSKANFFLVKIPDTFTSTEFMLYLLSKFGIYVRDCNDKIGLEQNKFVRIASRKAEENAIIIECLKQLT